MKRISSPREDCLYRNPIHSTKIKSISLILLYTNNNDGTNTRILNISHTHIHIQNPYLHINRSKMFRTNEKMINNTIAQTSVITIINTLNERWDA